MAGIATLDDVLRIENSAEASPQFGGSYEILANSSIKHKDKPALSFFLETESYKTPKTWTYGELFEEVNRTANFFNSLGATKDSVIAFVLPNLPQTHWVIWGGEATGIVFAVNPLLESSAIAELLKAAGTEIVVTLAPFPGSDLWQKVAASLDSVPSVKHVVTVSLADQVDGLKGRAAQLIQRAHVVKECGVWGMAAAVPKGVKWHDFGSAVRKQNASSLDSGRVFDRDDKSSYFCTGGTTGLPKIAMRKHKNEVANAWSASRFLGDGISSEKTIFCGLPLFHVNGVLVTGLVPFSVGAHVVLGPPQGYRTPGLVADFWNIVEHHKINFFSGVPTLYAGLLQVPVEGADISSLEFGLCGAAPMPLETFRRFEELTGLKILEGYGLTEGTCVSSVNPPEGERRLGSIGIRIPGQSMKAVVLGEDGQYQRDANVDEVGALVIRGDNVFSGYKIESQNEGLWVDQGEAGVWLNTGDLGRQDADGYFYLTGRKKELIIRGGHNIDPASIEAPLHKHPAVELAAAVGRPDAHAGELPVAYVQLEKGQVATEAELLEYLQTAISERAAVPKQVTVVEEMPLTGVGKIFKPALKKREIFNVFSEQLERSNAPYTKLDVLDSKELGVFAEIVVPNEDAQHQVEKVLGTFSVPLSVLLGDQ